MAGPNLTAMAVRRISRRIFLKDLGKGIAAAAVFPLVAACSTDGEGASSTSVSPSTTGPATSDPPATTDSAPDTTAAADTTTTEPTTDASGQWSRVVLGGVSAYILARGDKAAVVDTGNPGSEGDIESALGAMGLSWDAVFHVIVTHLHPDHLGSLNAVMTAGTRAEAHGGEADIVAMNSPRPINPVGDGDEVFGLEIIETPGHTAGHISVYDPNGKVLVAGDALNGAAGRIAGANPQFTPDMPTANESAKKLAALDFDTAYFGHGEPVLSGANELMAALAAEL